METDFPECDQFLIGDHRREICRGERKDLSLQQINAYRNLWGGLPPIESKVFQSSIVVSRPSSYQTQITPPTDNKPTRWVGTNLALLLKKFNVQSQTGCGGCDAWINDMNVWGPDGCQERFTEIKNRLKSKATELHANAGRVKILKIGITMLVKAQWPSIDALIKKAIKQARKSRNQ